MKLMSERCATFGAYTSQFSMCWLLGTPKELYIYSKHAQSLEEIGLKRTIFWWGWNQWYHCGSLASYLTWAFTMTAQTEIQMELQRWVGFWWTSRRRLLMTRSAWSLHEPARRQCIAASGLDDQRATMYGWPPMAPSLTGVWTVFLWHVSIAISSPLILIKCWHRTLGNVKPSLIRCTNLIWLEVLLGWKSEMEKTLLWRLYPDLWHSHSPEGPYVKFAHYVCCFWLMHQPWPFSNDISDDPCAAAVTACPFNLGRDCRFVVVLMLYIRLFFLWLSVDICLTYAEAPVLIYGCGTLYILSGWWSR